MTQVSRKGFRDKNGQKVVLKDPTKADKVSGATAGNFAGLDPEGNLFDTGMNDESFAAANHEHREIKQEYSSQKRATVYCAAGEDTDPAVYISIKSGPMAAKTVGITNENIYNLYRAVQTPDSAPTADSDKLITSEAVYGALHKSALYFQGGGQFEFTKTSDGYSFLDDATDEEEIEGYMSLLRETSAENAVVPAIIVVYNGTSSCGGLGFFRWYETRENEGTASEVAHTNFEFYFGDNILKGRVSISVGDHYSSTGLATVTNIGDVFTSSSSELQSNDSAPESQQGNLDPNP